MITTVLSPDCYMELATHSTFVGDPGPDTGHK